MKTFSAFRRLRAFALVTACCVLALPAFSLTAAEPSPPPLDSSRTIVFLGDSITQSSVYIAYLDAWLYQNYPETTFDIINLGLSSETASGDSEPGHPFPRPCIHERLDRVLAKSKPDLVFACYGMNDGIYHPFGEERFQNYRRGIEKLVKKCRKAGAEVILLTPPPFDGRSKELKGKKLLPADAASFSFKDGYADYDDVLEKYGAFIESLTPEDGVTSVIDLHTPLEAHIAARRADDPGYAYGDGIHPPADGHAVMAQTILAALGADDVPDYSVIAVDQSDPFHPALQLILKRRRLLGSAWLQDVGHQRPTKAKAPPLDEAQAEAARLDAEIRALIEETATVPAA